MHLDTLKLDGFRNLQSQVLALSPQFNVFHGENGSGKTSLLESVYLLSTGRSFRSRISKNFICFNQPSCTVFGETAESAIGVQKTAQGRTQAKINGNTVSSAQMLSTTLPCHIFYSGSFDVLEGGPGKRRGFYDWLVFHVKQSFRRDWSEYMRCLKQRNSLLRRDKIDSFEFKLWNAQLAELGESIADTRESVLPAFLAFLQQYCEACGFDVEALDLCYNQGWEEDKSLLDALDNQIDKDYQRGHTSSGPHKSDFVVKYYGRPVADTLSRGQLKTLIVAMHLARIASFKQCLEYYPVILVDDLPSELDRSNLEMALGWLKALDTQVLLTCVSSQIQLVNMLKVDKPEALKMFHVKHGLITAD